MTNYENRTIEPIVAAAVDEIRRKFLTEDDRANRESVMYFRDLSAFDPLFPPLPKWPTSLSATRS